MGGPGPPGPPGPPRGGMGALARHVIEQRGANAVRHWLMRCNCCPPLARAKPVSLFRARSTFQARSRLSRWSRWSRPRHQSRAAASRLSSHWSVPFHAPPGWRRSQSVQLAAGWRRGARRKRFGFFQTVIFFGEIMRGCRARVDVACVVSNASAYYRNDCRKRKIADVACRGSTCSQFVLRTVSLRM